MGITTRSLVRLVMVLSITVLGTPISPGGEAARITRQSRAGKRLILIVVMDGLRPIRSITKIRRRFSGSVRKA